MRATLKRTLRPRRPTPKRDVLDRVDLCLVIDTTGSMGPLIEEARRPLVALLERAAAYSDIDLEVGLVAYRDHPPQERSFIASSYPLTDDLRWIGQALSRLRPCGGGDEAEAVYWGVYTACTTVMWRAHSSRFLVLVGDAPPHGFADWHRTTDRSLHRRGQDAWPDGCPSGLDPRAIVAAAEAGCVNIHALCVGGNPLARQAFDALARPTGGRCVEADGAGRVAEEVDVLLLRASRHVAFDRRLLAALATYGERDIPRLAARLACTEVHAAASLARLAKRGLLEAVPA